MTAFFFRSPVEASSEPVGRDEGELEAEVLQAREPEIKVPQAGEPESEVAQTGDPEPDIAQAVESEPEGGQAGEPDPESTVTHSSLRRKPEVELTIAQLEHIAHILQKEENSFYYDKGKVAHRDARKREVLNAALAGAVGLTGESIRIRSFLQPYHLLVSRNMESCNEIFPTQARDVNR